jgi:predicted transcriptional regulator
MSYRRLNNKEIRKSILKLLTDSGCPQTTNSVAKGVGIHHNTAIPYLSMLVTDGFVECIKANSVVLWVLKKGGSA